MSKYETAQYKVLEKDGSFEIRSYESYVTAVVDEESMKGSRGFNQIFGYISGNNAKKEKISMTTPVMNELAHGKVTTEFVMPSHYSRESLPEPDNTNIQLKKKEERLCASVTFSGSVYEDKIKEYEEKLRKWVAAKHLKTIGGFRLARYNSPFTPPIFRRNEILIDVEKT